MAGPVSDAAAITAIRAVNDLIDTANAAIAGNEHERASIMLALLESFTVELEKLRHQIHGAWQCHPLAGGFHTLTARFRSVKAKYLKQFDDGKKDEITKNLKDAQDNFRNAIKINASSLGFDRKNTASAIESYIDFLKETKLDAGEQDYFETMLANLQTPEKATAGLGALQNTVPDWLRGGRCSIAMSAPDKP